MSQADWIQSIQFHKDLLRTHYVPSFVLRAKAIVKVGSKGRIEK